MTTYPLTPGCKVDGPSKESATAERKSAKTLRDQVIRTLEQIGPRTADQCAGWLGESVLAIRPRFSELRSLGIIEDTGQRRPNASGHRATVWRIKANPPLKQAEITFGQK